MKEIKLNITPPPSLKKQILVSAALACLISTYCLEAGEIQENGNKIIFEHLGDTFTPSGGVYSVASGENKTIEIKNGVQTSYFKGGIDVRKGGELSFLFGGMDTLHNSGLIEEQNFYIGNQDSEDALHKQINNDGVVNFDFASGASGELAKRYDFGEIDTRDSQIINNSMMNFNIRDNAVFALRPKVLNQGKMVFNIGKESALDLQVQTSALTNNGGEMVFNIQTLGDIITRYGNYEEGIVSISGNTILNFKNTYFSGISSNITNKRGATTTLNFENAKASQIYPYKLISENDQQPEFVFNLKDSLVLLGADIMQNLKINFQSMKNEVIFLGERNQIVWVNSSTNSQNVILTGMYHPSTMRDYFVYRNDYRTLEIGKKGDKSGNTGIAGDNISFIVYVNLENKAQKIDSDDGWTPIYQDKKPVIDEVKTQNPTLAGHSLQTGYYAYSDRVIIYSSQGNKGGVYDLGVVFSHWDLDNLLMLSYNGGDVTTKGNIAVATVADSSNVTLSPLSGTILGFNLVESTFKEVKTNEQGVIQSNAQDNTYTTYFLSSAKDTGVSPTNQAVTSSVFALNYDLFIANFNSLNKRMGDLRDNPYTQGAWGRIFNGRLSNDFGLGSINNYTTLQAGYDYDFLIKDAKNYLGVAFAYGFSISNMSSNASSALQNKEIKDIFSNNIELALYNAYVEDSGLYSDSIIKFSYLISDFNLTNNGVSESLSINNYAFQLSEELGYVFALGETKEWSVTPQAELSFGYYSDSDLKQVVGEFYMDAKAKSLLMLRSRVGAMVAYDFKKYTQEMSATLYAGLSYEYDCLSGGDIELTPNVGKATTTKSVLSNDGRGILNLGTNIALKNDIRLYADFQTSFGGKINTDYQINLGARFSFGEKEERKEVRGEIVPLKIEG